MEIEKKNINIVKTVYEGDVKSSAEGSIIVPDSKPDILKVSEVTAEPYLIEKQIENGKITLKGKVRINILYLPEGETGRLESINGCFEFCETLKRSEFKDDMTLCAFCDAEKVSYKVLNSRKIGIETKILIGVSVFLNEQKELVSGVLSNDAETKSKEFSMTGTQKYEEFGFLVDEEIDFPKGKKASRLLKADMCILSKEGRALDGKLVIKGALGICILYSDAQGKYNHLDCEIPFTEVFDFGGLKEDEECEISYEIGETAYELLNTAEDTSGIKVSADITVGVRTEDTENVSVISDCYFTDSDCIFAYEDIKMQSIASQIKFSAVLKQLLEKEEGAPDILGVYRVQAKPSIESSKVQNGKLDVSGKVLIYVLYLTDDEQNPIASIKEEVPFNYIIDCDGQISEDNKTVLDVECDHISYVINSKDSVEVRCGLTIYGKIINILNESVISDIKAEPRENSRNGIAVYFVKEGDSLWDIAKHYRIKTDKILTLNNLDSGYVPAKGEKLIIPMS
jgi:LysM repeat protein